MVPPPHRLPLRHRHKHHLPLHPRNHRLRTTEPQDELRAGLSRRHHLSRLCWRTRPHLVHHHLRDLVGATPRAEHSCGTVRVLHY